MSKISRILPPLFFAIALLVEAGSPEMGELCPDIGFRLREPIRQLKNASDGDPLDAANLKMVSLNIHGVRSSQGIEESLAASANLADADLYLLQEVEETEAERAAEDLGARLGMGSLFAAAETREGGQLHGLAILSRYPLQEPSVIRLPHNRLRVNTRCRIALAATVDGPVGPVRVVNLHLDTRISAEKRLEQLSPILESARSFQGPFILAGDFNTQDFHWVGSVLPVPRFRFQAKQLRQQLESEGFSTPFQDGTKTHSWAPLKLDWIFTRGVAVRGHGLEAVEFSDHRALWVTVSRNP